MYRNRVQITLGYWLLACLLILGFFVILLLSNTNLLRNGVTTQGVIVNYQAIYCGKSGTKNIFSVRFTDQTGQAHTSTISQCDNSDFNAYPGTSVTIVYLPDDPTMIATPDGLLYKVRFDLIGIILCGLITLILLPLWIRKRIRLASQQDQPEQNAIVAGDAKDQGGTEDYRPLLDSDIIGGPTPGEP